MSRDVFIFAAGIETRQDDGGQAVFAEDFQPLVIGTAGEVRRAISAVWPATDWTDPTLGRLRTRDYGIEIGLGREAEINQIMVMCHGVPDRALGALRQATDWQMFDTATGGWMREVADVETGTRAFRGFLSRILGRRP